LPVRDCAESVDVAGGAEGIVLTNDSVLARLPTVIRRTEFSRVEFSRVEYSRVEYSRVEYSRVEYSRTVLLRAVFPRAVFPRGSVPKSVATASEVVTGDRNGEQSGIRRIYARRTAVFA